MTNQKIVAMYSEISRRSPFDILSSGRYFLNSFAYQKKLAHDILDKLEISSNDRILDLGCNVGLYHKEIAQKSQILVGVDGTDDIIARAKKRNKLSNVNYLAFDLMEEWPKFENKFNKVLVYSVIHFFDSLENVRDFFQKITLTLDQDPGSKVLILFGEVRTKEQVDQFQREQKDKTSITWRDRRFQFNKILQKFLLGEVKGYPSKSFPSQDLLNIGEQFGFKGTQIKQEKFHPFYNTCSDFIFERRI